MPAFSSTSIAIRLIAATPAPPATASLTDSHDTSSSVRRSASPCWSAAASLAARVAEPRSRVTQVSFSTSRRGQRRPASSGAPTSTISSSRSNSPSSSGGRHEGADDPELGAVGADQLERVLRLGHVVVDLDPGIQLVEDARARVAAGRAPAFPTRRGRACRPPDRRRSRARVARSRAAPRRGARSRRAAVRPR